MLNSLVIQRRAIFNFCKCFVLIVLALEMGLVAASDLQPATWLRERTHEGSNQFCFLSASSDLVAEEFEAVSLVIGGSGPFEARRCVEF